MPAFLHDLPAPAKLNLFLHVTGRRDDGYHLLETVFELIDLRDSIDLDDDPGGAITLATPTPGVPPETDLTVRAARLLAGEAGIGRGVRIALRKRIPMGAGLGGGSSDAATVLRGLNTLWDLHWPNERLARIGLALGADVPVFVAGRPAFATGVGERLLPIPLPGARYVLLMPDAHVPTAAAFQADDLTRDTKSLKIDSLSQLGRVLQAIERGKNDLQAVVARRYPPVEHALVLLRQAARHAGASDAAVRMSGSGASVFLPVDGDAQAARVIDRLSAAGVRTDPTGACSGRPAPRAWVVGSWRDPAADRSAEQ
ncbi:MAG: 4-(cytidine 5'-diphospho)-2-C-methyl-D-erythritol kinase [Burkholderiaceae bacterium]